jgi:DNA adenine methylase
MRQSFLLPECESLVVEKPTNVASVPQRSPFRYPGGKTWFVPRFRQWMQSFTKRPRLLIEPFAGGAVLGLTAAFERLADKVLLIELDEQVAAVWETILSDDVNWLIQRIVSFELSVESVRQTLERQPKSRREMAFQTLLKNRTAHGGILASGAGRIKNGEKGKGIHSRWYPKTIAKRIAAIVSVASKIEFHHADAFEILEKYKNSENAVFFIDPPYTAGGKRAGSRLYNHSFVDHSRLFSLAREIKGDCLMTYDNACEVQTMAEKYGFETSAIPMKNTHHAELDELLIGKDLSWIGTKN